MSSYPITRCECPGHSGPNAHTDECIRLAESEDTLLCVQCKRGKPLCWNSGCPGGTSYPHPTRPVCREWAS